MSQENGMQQDCDDGEDCAPESGNAPPKKSQQYDNDEGQNKKSQANSNWHYDSNKHKRNKYKDQRYKYYYGGFWYLEPYWSMPGYGYRVSCGEGRQIVRDNGFKRVQTMECEGRNYTYAGSRRGIPFRIVLNSRSGDIVSARPM